MGRFRFCKGLKIKHLKTVVYVGGFNLYYSLKKTKYKWLDIGKLSSLMLQEKHEIIKIKYFTALIKSSEEDPSKPERQKFFWTVLKSIPNLEIIEGRFKRREIYGTLIWPSDKGINKGEIVRIRKYEEKESDVNIASHIILDSTQKDVECIVLISNDTDLRMPLLISKEKFNKKIGVISPYNPSHVELKKVSHFHKIIDNEILAECQFPEEVAGIKKPSTW